MDDFERDYYETSLKVIADKKATKEIKIFLILELMGERLITTRKAHELCEEYGLYKNGWVGVDAKTVKLWEKCWKK